MKRILLVIMLAVVLSTTVIGVASASQQPIFIERIGRFSQQPVFVE